MGGGRKIFLSFEERKVIEECLQRGEDRNAIIGRRLGRWSSCIRNERRRYGKIPYSAAEAQKVAISTALKRIEKLKKGLTPYQIRIIESGIATGSTKTRIRNLVGCSYISLERYLDEHNLVCRSPLQLKPLEERVESLEQHISIILDQIKELRKLCQQQQLAYQKLEQQLIMTCSKNTNQTGT
jgi:hypothetical protein